MGFPMVCFCDIPLSRVSSHVKLYGGYGLGMTRQWAEQNALSPVLYLVPNGPLTTTVLSFIREQISTDDAAVRESRYQRIRHLHAYVKPTTGEIDGETREFFQESEWRFVPADRRIQDHLHPLAFNDQAQLDAAHETTRLYAMLRFKPDDIQHILVQSEQEVADTAMFVWLNFNFGTERERLTLISKISSLESIPRDYERPGG